MIPRIVQSALLVVAASACSSAPLLPAPEVGWFRQGIESQVIILRRIHLDLQQGGATLRSDFLERRLIRKATVLTLRVPQHPQRQIDAVAAEWRQVSGQVHPLNAREFVPVDRHDRPVESRENAAFLAARVQLPAGSLVSLRWIATDRAPAFLPRLELSGPYPINRAELRLGGEGFEQFELVTRKLQAGLLRSSEHLIGTWRNLQPASAHPWAPGELGKRTAWLRWKVARHPGLVARLLADPKADFQLQTLPAVSRGGEAIPCLLRPWGVEQLRPDTAVLTTASRLPEGGYNLNLPDAFRRPFADCTLIQPGALARIPVRSQDGSRVLRLRTTIGGDGQLKGRGQLVYSGAGAAAVRRGALNMTAELKALLAPIAQSLRIAEARMGGTGPVHLPFSLSLRATELNPSRWLATPLPELSYLPPGIALGPQTNHRQVEWVFQWPVGQVPPPPTRMASASRGPMAASSTWSLGPQRSLRFVRSVRWQNQPAAVDPRSMVEALRSINLPPVALPNQ